MNIGGISAGYSYWDSAYGGQQTRGTAADGYGSGSGAAETAPGSGAAGAFRTVPGSRATGTVPGSGAVEAAGASAGGRAAGVVPGSRAAGAAGASGAVPEEGGRRIGRKSSPEECQTCKERKYQDGSDENVSFKAATHIAPEAAGAAVRAHEGEHVANAYAKAAEKNGEVVNASVTIHTAICPECGRTYVSGGTTRTSIKYSNESNPYQQNRKALDAIRFRGQNIDYAA